MENLNIKKIFSEPKVIGVVGNPNEAKSNLIYYIIQELKKDFKFNLVTFGLRINVGGRELHSVKELEQTKDSIIFLDEFNSLFNLEDRKNTHLIEQTLRIIYHNNNILVLIGASENFKKFISARLNIIIYKKIFYDDAINGSKVKRVIMDYNDIDNIKGSSVLNLDKDQALIYDGDSYILINIPYLKEFDTKANNNFIIKEKCENNVEKKCK